MPGFDSYLEQAQPVAEVPARFKTIPICSDDDLNWLPMPKLAFLSRPAILGTLLATVLFPQAGPAQAGPALSFSPLAPFPLGDPSDRKALVISSPVISRPTQGLAPFTVAGPRGVLVGTQDGQFESWILPVKLLSHMTIEANVEGYSVPIEVNPQSANIEVRPDRTTLTYSHIAFTLRQIMFSPDAAAASAGPSTGPVVLFQIDSNHALDLTFRFTPEMRWMWPKRNDGIPGAEWVKSGPAAGGRLGELASEASGYYTLHMDYPDLAGAVTIPTATPGILAPYQERPQVHPLELHLHYDPKRDGRGEDARYFPLLMAVGTTRESATNAALGQSLAGLNAAIPGAWKAHAAGYQKLLAGSTSIDTPDQALNQAFQWGVASIEQLKAHDYASNQEGLVAGYFASGDSARPGFGWFFGRDSLYTLYAINGFGDFALSRAELEFLIARQRHDGKIMHEYSQTAGDPAVDWKQFSYMYAAADATPLFLMALRDYYRASGDLAFLQNHKEAIERAWAFETAPTSDGDHDGIYDNSQGTGWVESWPADPDAGSNTLSGMPHQEIYMALLDEQASMAYAAVARALGSSEAATTATSRAAAIKSKIEQEYFDAKKGCYAFATNPPGTAHAPVDLSATVYPAIAWWDRNEPAAGATVGPPLAHPEACLARFAGPALATDWGLRDVSTAEAFYDGMSYHQGSVWPLFTGWAALAEYRGNQPLPAEQMLMENVDLTWAQDPGAVTELLSGDYFVPFGRSTSHQLWSSAMVLTPTLRGLFGINLDAATDTITVNPHLPAGWNHAEVHQLHLGGETVSLVYQRENGVLKISALTDQGNLRIHLRTDEPNAKVGKSGGGEELAISLPAVELALGEHSLPNPGSRTSRFKVLAQEYGVRKLTLRIEGEADSYASVVLQRNQRVVPKLALSGEGAGIGDPKTESMNEFVMVADHADVSKDPKKMAESIPLKIHFPKGRGWQTLEFTVTW